MNLAFPNDSSEMELFPELPEFTDSTEAKGLNAKTKIGKTTPPGNNVTLVKVKMKSNQEEELIKYLTGRCSTESYELENIVDVTDDVSVSDLSPCAITVDLMPGQEAGELVTHSSSGSDGDDSSGLMDMKNVVSQSHKLSSGSQSSNGDNMCISLSGRPSYNLSGSKAAQSARENRIKKKNYINGLEKSVSDLSKENKELRSEVDSLKGNVGSLRTEVAYLKNVIANQSMLSSLLKNTLKTPGVTFFSSEFDDLTDLKQKDTEKQSAVHNGSNKRSLEDDLHLSSDEEETTVEDANASAVAESQVSIMSGSKRRPE